MKLQIRRLIAEKAAFECECCGKAIKRAGKFEFRHAQYVPDYIPQMQVVCRMCVYKLSFATKGVMAIKRANTIEIESYKYEDID